MSADPLDLEGIEARPTPVLDMMAQRWGTVADEVLTLREDRSRLIEEVRGLRNENDALRQEIRSGRQTDAQIAKLVITRDAESLQALCCELAAYVDHDHFPSIDGKLDFVAWRDRTVAALKAVAAKLGPLPVSQP